MLVPLENTNLAMGTSFKGIVHCEYAKLVDLLGAPNATTDRFKTDVEWRLRDTMTGCVVTIYNYKDGRSYLGDNGRDVAELTEWHVGGHNKVALELVEAAVNGLEDNHASTP